MYGEQSRSRSTRWQTGFGPNQKAGAHKPTLRRWSYATAQTVIASWSPVRLLSTLPNTQEVVALTVTSAAKLFAAEFAHPKMANWQRLRTCVFAAGSYEEAVGAMHPSTEGLWKRHRRASCCVTSDAKLSATEFPQPRTLQMQLPSLVCANGLKLDAEGFLHPFGGRGGGDGGGGGSECIGGEGGVGGVDGSGGADGSGGGSIGGVRNDENVTVGSVARVEPMREAADKRASNSSCVALPRTSITAVLTVVVVRVKFTPVPVSPREAAVTEGPTSSSSASVFDTHSSVGVTNTVACSRLLALFSPLSLSATTHDAALGTPHASADTLEVSVASCEAFQSRGDVSVSWSTLRMSTVDTVTFPGRLLASVEAASST